MMLTNEEIKKLNSYVEELWNDLIKNLADFAGVDIVKKEEPVEPEKTSEEKGTPLGFLEELLRGAGIGYEEVDDEEDLEDVFDEADDDCECVNLIRGDVELDIDSDDYREVTLMYNDGGKGDEPITKDIVIAYSDDYEKERVGAALVVAFGEIIKEQIGDKLSANEVEAIIHDHMAKALLEIILKAM